MTMYDSQHWWQEYYKLALCRRHRRPSRKGRGASRLGGAPWQDFYSLRHADQCRKDQTDDQQHQWLQPWHQDQFVHARVTWGPTHQQCRWFVPYICCANITTRLLGGDHCRSLSSSLLHHLNHHHSTYQKNLLNAIHSCHRRPVHHMFRQSSLCFRPCGTHHVRSDCFLRILHRNEQKTFVGANCSTPVSTCSNGPMYAIRSGRVHTWRSQRIVVRWLRSLDLLSDGPECPPRPAKCF